MKRNNKGFTLLELLVVISIIGILIVIGSVAFTTAQQKGRDARRRGDIKAIQNAMEQYYANNNSSYPSSACDTALSTNYFNGDFPTDPKTGVAYPFGTCNATDYCVCAQLDDSTGGNFGTGCAAGTSHYCLQELQ